MRYNRRHIHPLWQKAAELFAIQFLHYFITTFNYRAIAEVRYVETFVTDICIAALVFVAIQRVALATTYGERIAYILGGAIGALTALWVTTLWF